ncbi:MAG: trypsin-like peptidase domain-containing protein [Anaerolineaceae bacterium]
MKKRYVVLSVLIVLVLIVGAVALLRTSPVSVSAQTGTVTATPTASGSLLTDGTVIEQVQSIYRSIYDTVNPSVVNIQVLGTYNYGFYVGAVSSQGSGFVWDTQGHIVTNNHVVENAYNITVTFSDGTTTTAEVVGTDVQSDLAVIKVDPSGLTLHPVSLGDSQTVKVGDLVIAIGNPYGLAGSMTQGIVSALSRSLTVDSSNPFSSSTYTIPDIIQTDAAVNPGNSGGVLVNTSGEVIGVTSAIQSTTNANAGIAFAIPSHIVERIVPVLIKDGKYQHPSLGLSGITLTANYATEMGLDANTHGVLITDITPGGAADLAGLKETTQQYTRYNRGVIIFGDVITEIDGNPVRTYEDLISYIFNKTEVGQRVELTILRDGKEMTVTATLQAE